jgi:FkbM family methyltransferase
MNIHYFLRKKMINIITVNCNKIEFEFSKSLTHVTIKLRSHLNNDIFYETYFEKVIDGVIYWMSHPRFYIENKIYLEIYEDNLITYSKLIGEGFFSKDPSHLSNLISDVKDSDIISRYNDSFFEIFINDNFNVEKNNSYVYNNVRNFIDLGGNCGFFARNIFNKNRNAKGVIVEPNPNLKEVIKVTNNNFNLILKERVFSDKNGDIIPFNVSNSFNDTAVSHQSNIDIGYTVSVKDFTNHQIESIDMEQIMNEFDNDDIIDILKVDIEGGEQHLNSLNNREIIKKRVKFILVETHSDKIENDLKNTFLDTFDILSESKPYGFNHIIFSNKNLLKTSEKKILLKIPCPAMGDTLCATPTIKKVYESYGSKVDVMAIRTDVLEKNPYIDKLLDYENDFKSVEYKEIFDLYVRSIKINKDFNPKLFDDNIIELKLSNFEARQIHALGVGISLYPEEMTCDFYPDPQTSKSILIDKNCIVLHVTDSWPNRTWEPKKWQRLIDLIKENTDLKIVTIGKSHSENGYHGTIDKKIIKLNNVDYDFTIDNEILDQKQQKDREGISEMWHILNNSYGLISFDSGPVHLAGTTDSWIFQIGASIRPEKTAPWRNGTQNYKFEFIGGECKLFCGSCPKYSVKEWGTINAMPYYPDCQEKYSEFKCQPSPDEVFFKLIEKYKNV